MSAKGKTMPAPDIIPAYCRRLFPLVALLLILLPALLSAEMITHRVVTGDTLYNISKRYGVSIDDIVTLNNLRGNTISLNQVLKIKEVDPYAAVPLPPAPESSLPPGMKLPADQDTPMFSASIDAEGNWLNIRRLPANALHGEDAAGNRYYAGILTGEMEFGQIILQERTSRDNHSDTWLACQDNAGKWRWAKPLAAVLSDVEPQLALAVGPSGSVYVAGSFSGEIELNSENIRSTGGSDIWLAKFDNGGNLLWQRQASSLDNVTKPALVVDANGNLCLAGEFSGTLSLGSLSIASGGETDIFAACLDSAGSWLWAVKTNGPKTENLRKLALAEDGAFIIAGTSTGNLTLGSGNIGSKPDPAGNVFFTSRLGSDGAWNWGSRVQQLSADCEKKCFDTDALGNTWFADNLYGNPLPNPIYDGALSVNSSLTLVDSQGKKVWNCALQGPDVSIDWISAGRAADVFVAGTFSGSLTLGAQTLAAGEQRAQFYARFDSAGKCLWARKWLGTDLHFLETDLAGNLYLVAKYRPYIDSGGEPYYLTADEGKLFVACLDENGTWLWAAQTGSTGSPDLLGAIPDTRGNLQITGSCPDEISFGALKP